MTDTETDGDITLEDQIYEVSELIDDFVQGVVEKEKDVDPINNGLIDFEKFKNNEVASAIKLKESKFLVMELSSSRVLSDYINLKTSENDYNFKQIAILIDLGFYLKQCGDSQFDLPIELIKVVIKETPVDWLLKFWNYFSSRASLIKQTKDGEVLQSIKHPGSFLLISLNLRIKQYDNSNDPQREMLKSKIMTLTSQLFPVSDRFLINRKFDINNERADEIRLDMGRNSSMFYKFWSIQRVLIDPIRLIGTPDRLKDFLTNVNDVYNAIYAIDGPEDGQTTSLKEKYTKEPSSDNRLNTYIKRDLPEGKRAELEEYYKKKEFSPSFFISAKRFREQFKTDTNLRRIVLFQLFFFCSFMISLVSDTDIFNKKFDKHPLRRLAITANQNIGRFNSLKRDFQFLFSSVDKRIFFVNQQLVNSEISFLQSKFQQLKTFSSTVFEEYKVGDEVVLKFNKLGEFKPRFWALYGTPAITKHWKIPTGLELLVKIETNVLQELDEKLEKLRNDIKNSENGDVNNLNSWKALRLARKKHLFKFKNVNEATGVEGLFDASLKEEYDKKKQEEDAKRKLEEIERKKEESERKTAEFKKQEDELERKRKASEEEFAEQSKRAKLDSAQSNGADDLDY